jgi:phage terminase Nu1 subunit (DNA packaging protein)
MKINAEVMQAVKALEDKRGRLTAQMVLQEARAASSPLHGFFEWDDSEAAEKWRLEQARELVRRVKIVVEVEDIKIKSVAYVRNVDMAPTEPGYISVLKTTKRQAAEIIKEELDNINELIVRVINLTYTVDDKLPAGLRGRLQNLLKSSERIKDQI